MMKNLIRLSMVAALSTTLSTAAPAQGWLTIGSNDASVVRIAPKAKLVVTVKLDMTNAGVGAGVDAISPGIDWNPAFLTLDSIKAGNFGSLFNIDSVRTAGTVTFNTARSPATTITRDLATLYFTAGTTPGGTRLSFGAGDASNGATHYTAGQLVGWRQGICVALPGVWGDVNSDNAVDIIDAQQIARSSVGATVTDSTRLANNGDVNGDGQVDVLDAQAVARQVVGLSAPARISPQPQARSVPPTTNTLTINNETLTLPVGSTQSLEATPFDANGFTIVGCQTASWTSDNPNIARVNAAGQVTGVSAGVTTIRATSGTAPEATSTVTVTP